MAVLPFAAAAAGARRVPAAVGVLLGIRRHQLGRCAVAHKQVGHHAHQPIDVVEEGLVAGTEVVLSALTVG